MGRQIQQDRADGAAILCAVVDARQHQDRRDGLHAESQRQQDRNGRHRSHSGQHADEIADQHTQKTIHQVVGLQCDAEAEPEILQCGTDHGVIPRSSGSGTPSR